MSLCYEWGLFDLKCLQDINYIDIVSNYVAANAVEPKLHQDVGNITQESRNHIRVVGALHNMGHWAGTV